LDFPGEPEFVNLVLHLGDDQPYDVRSILGELTPSLNLTPQGFSGGGDLLSKMALD